MGIIYKALCTITQKVYIGQTTQSLQRRMSNHFTGKGCKYFHAAIVKYGRMAFVWEILEEHSSKESLDEAEIKWIKYYNSTDPSKGYNLSEGGNGGGRHPCSAESNQKRRETMLRKYETMTPEDRQIFASQKGVKKSEETKQKLSQSHKGQVFTEEHRRKLIEARNLREEVSVETRQKISAANKGKIRSVESREKYRQAAIKREFAKKQKGEMSGS